MDYDTFVYKSIMDGALKRGAWPAIAEQEALSGRGSFRRNQFKTPTDLIKKHIENAVRTTKKAQETTK